MNRPYTEVKEIDYETGEIKREIVKTKVSGEPPYIKLYLKTLCCIKGLSLSLNPVLDALLSYMTYADPNAEEGGQLIVVNGFVRQKVADKCGVSIESVNKALTKFTKSGVFRRIGTGTYQVNPEYFGKGEWKDISNIIATIDFKTGNINAVVEKTDKQAGIDNETYR